MDVFTILAGTANPGLAAAIARELGVRLGGADIARFPDGEVAVQLLEPVRRKEVFIIQPTAPPVDEHLVELLAIVDACRRAAAAHIIAVVPYFGYARMDKRHRSREPITASMVATMFQAVGVDQVITVDLHAPQIEGFFQIPVDCLSAVPALATALRGHLPPNAVVVSPDAGRVRMAGEYAHVLGLPVAVLHKRRESGATTRVTHLVGEVADRPCLIIDDMISTGGTIAEGLATLLEAGARPEIVVAATHGLLLEGVRDRLEHPSIRAVFVTDSVAVPITRWPQLHVVSIAPLLAQAIGRFLSGGALDELS
jgi:ribose-phosphate pyrophosphokinase